MKNKALKHLAIYAAAAMIGASLFGCGNSGTAVEKKEAVSTSSSIESSSLEEETLELTEEDVDLFLDGIEEDINALVNTKDFDPASLILMDGQIIKGVKTDLSKVDYTKEGTYTITYTVVIDEDGYKTYRADMDSYEPSFKEARILDEIPEGAVTVTFTQEVTVVTKEKAEELAKTNTPVYTDGGKLAVDTVTDTADTVEEANKKAEEKAETKAEETKTETKTDTAAKTDAGTSGAATTKTNTNTSGNSGSSSKANTNNSGSSTKNNTSSGNSGSASTNKGNSSSTNKGNTSSGSGSSGNKGNTSSGTTQTHTHSWTPVTKTVHHEAVYTKEWVQTKAAWTETVVVEEAWDEPVKEIHTVCGACGFDFSANGYTPDQLADHMGDHMMKGESSRYYSTEVQVDTIHHDAVTSTVNHEAEGYYQDKLVSAAYDETVTTGYTCSCGATK